MRETGAICARAAVRAVPAIAFHPTLPHNPFRLLKLGGAAMTTRIRTSSRLAMLPAMLTTALLAAACSKPAPPPEPADTPAAETPATLAVTDAALSDESNTAQWAAYGGTHYERRYSPLTDIDVGNVGELKVDWYLDLPRDVGLVSTPLVVDGVMYFTGTMNVVRAVDPATGELLWQFDPEVGKALAGKRQAGFVHNRGLSFYGDKVYTATWD